jgi:putative DNA methylase
MLKEPGEDTWALFYKNNCFSSVVFDPFMGSGTTLGEAIKMGARVVGCDINPISSFLVKQELTNIPLHELDSHMKHLEEIVAPKIKKYYTTIDPDTHKQIPVLYYFWVKLVVLPNGETMPLFSNYVFAKNAYPSKKPAAQILCSKCWGVFTGRYDLTDATCPHCNNRFNPQVGPVKGAFICDKDGNKHKIKSLLPTDKRLEEKMFAVLALRHNGEKIYLRSSNHDDSLYQEAVIQLEKGELPLPTMAVRTGHNTDQARGYNYNLWRNFFNERQLLCLGLLLNEILKITDDKVREQFLCLFSSTLEFNNMFCSYKGEGTGAVRPIFSNHILKPERTPLENTVWGTDKSSGCFSTLYKTRFVPAKKYLKEPFELKITDHMEKSCKVYPNTPMNPITVSDWQALSDGKGNSLILCGDSANVPLPNASVDLVVTDPPYFDYIHYSELSDFFYAWLSPVLKNKYIEFRDDTSGRENEVQHTSPSEFSKMLCRVFRECSRVMKDEAKLCFSFHHARPEGWAAIAEALIGAGFYIEEAFPVHAELIASTPKAGTKEPISLDTIIVCSKQRQVIEDVSYIASEYLDILSASSSNISRSDIFTVYAAQTIVISVNQRKTSKDILTLLEKDLLISDDRTKTIEKDLPNRITAVQNQKGQQIVQLSFDSFNGH